MCARKRIWCLFGAICLFFMFQTPALASEDYSGKTVVLYTVGPQDCESAQSAYAAVKAWRAHYEALGAEVLAFSLGDDFSGTAFAEADEGMAVLALMNAAGYNAMAVGDGDFAYGVTRLLDLGMGADFELLCSNLTTASGDFVLAPFALYGDIGVVGFCTPQTEAFVSDDKLAGYTFNGDMGLLFLQQCIDEVLAQGAKTVILLSHMDDDEANSPWRIGDLLPRLENVDIWIGGHAQDDAGYEGVYEKNASGANCLRVHANAPSVGCIVLDGASYEAFDAGTIEGDQALLAAAAAFAQNLKSSGNASMDEAQTPESQTQEEQRSYPAPTGTDTGSVTLFAPACLTASVLSVLCSKCRRRK